MSKKSLIIFYYLTIACLILAVYFLVKKPYNLSQNQAEAQCVPIPALETEVRKGPGISGTVCCDATEGWERTGCIASGDDGAKKNEYVQIFAKGTHCCERPSGKGLYQAICTRVRRP